MNGEKAVQIMRVVDGDEAKDGLATVGMALIHLAYCCGYTKDDVTHALAGQWDLYIKKRADEAGRAIN